jgi:hypothetical protein
MRLGFIALLSFLLSARFCRSVITFSTKSLHVQATYPQINKGEKKQALYNLFAAYIHTVPLEELMESFERARRDAQLRYVAIYGAACSYCLSIAERLDVFYVGRLISFPGINSMPIAAPLLNRVSQLSSCVVLFHLNLITTV